MRLPRHVISCCGLGLSSLLLPLATLAQQPATYHPDWKTLAEVTVRRSLKLHPGQRVLLHFDARRDPELVAALRAAITSGCGVISGEIVWPSPETSRHPASLTLAERRRRFAQEDAGYRRLFAHSDVYLWIHTPTGPDKSRRFERMIHDSKIRAVHLHWVDPKDSAGADQALQVHEKAAKAKPR